MAYTPVSALLRPMSHAQNTPAKTTDPSALTSVNKWVILRALVKAQDRFAVSARDLTLLQALLSFYPHDMLQAGAEMVIFPSNKTICDRMNGMADSTMRRHLRHLLEAGLLTRRDSCNGKRFAIQHHDQKLAFGFDLTPLLRNAPFILTAAAEVEEQEKADRYLRAELQLMRRDIFAMIETVTGDLAQSLQNYWATGQKALRRKLSSDDLKALHNDHRTLLDHLKTSNLNSTDSQNEQHKHNSNINIYESEEAMTVDPKCEIAAQNPQSDIPLHVIMKACPLFESFNNAPINHWSHFIDAAHRLYQALGISKDTYAEAVKCLGLHQASIVIAALFQRFDQLRSPGAYLRALVKKAYAGKFSYRPMVMALLSNG